MNLFMYLIIIDDHKYLVAAPNDDKAMAVLIKNLRRIDIDEPTEATVFKILTPNGLKIAGYSNASDFKITDFRQVGDDFYVSYISNRSEFGKCNIACALLEVA